MKTFEEEYAELVAWCKKAYAEADKKISKLPHIGGHDDRAIIFTRPVTQEWNRRLTELKKKYGKETKVQEQIPQSVGYASGK
jgi:hypothetical protein